MQRRQWWQWMMGIGLMLCLSIGGLSAEAGTQRVTTNTDSGGKVQLTSDDIPVFVYLRDNDVWLATCSNRNCTILASNELLQATPDASLVELAVDSQDRPVIAYFDPTNVNINLIFCQNTTCTQRSNLVTLNPTGQVNGFAMTLDAADNPVMSYKTFSDGGSLNLLRCTSANCGTFTANAVDTTTGLNGAGIFQDIALDANGLPVIAHHADYTENGQAYQALRLSRCTTADCSTSQTTSLIPGDYPVGAAYNYKDGWYTQLLLDPNGVPIISGVQRNADGSQHRLRVYRCADANCTSFTTNTVRDVTGDDELVRQSIQRTADGTLTVSFRLANPVSPDSLFYALCVPDDCSTSLLGTRVFGSFGINAGNHVLDSDDNPVIVFGTLVTPGTYNLWLYTPLRLITNEPLDVEVNSSTRITQAELDTLDVGAARDLRYTTTNPQFGTLNSTSFTQADIYRGNISYTAGDVFPPDGTDSFTFTVIDGLTTIGNFTFTINYTGTAPPTPTPTLTPTPTTTLTPTTTAPAPTDTPPDATAAAPPPSSEETTLESVDELPNTGESPWWRNWLGWFLVLSALASSGWWWQQRRT